MPAPVPAPSSLGAPASCKKRQVAPIVDVGGGEPQIVDGVRALQRWQRLPEQADQPIVHAGISWFPPVPSPTNVAAGALWNAAPHQEMDLG